MSLFDQGGLAPDVIHPDVAAFLAQVRGKDVHQLKESVHGRVTVKCGKTDVPRGEWDSWGTKVTCLECIKKMVKPHPNSLSILMNSEASNLAK